MTTPAISTITSKHDSSANKKDIGSSNDIYRKNYSESMMIITINIGQQC